MSSATDADLHLFEARVAHNAPEGTARRLTLAVDEPIDPNPGQFLQVGRSGSETYLKRPLSISDWDAARGLLELLILPVGRGTRHIASARPGEMLTLLGPLGRGFPSPDELGAAPLLVGGGIGSAPLVFLARRLAASGNPPTTFIGASDGQRLAGEKSLAGCSRRLVLATEDGSRGEIGMVTSVIWEHLDGLEGITSIAACGPAGLLEAVKILSDRLGVPAFGSFEERMACGVGACLGCAIPMAKPGDGKKYLRVCADGPVFALEEVAIS